MKPSKDEFFNLLKAYNTHTNIYSKTAYEDLDYHYQDGVCLSDIIGDNKLVLDFGSGAGFPAVPIAITKPSTTVLAVESKSRKTAFLKSVVNELGLQNLSVLNQDINQLSRNQWKTYDFITAKAFGPLAKIQKIVRSKMRKGQTLIMPVSANQATSSDRQSIGKIEKREGQQATYYYHLIAY